MEAKVDFVQEMKSKAKSLQKKLVLPEGSDPRTVKAARIIADEKLAASVFLLGKESDVEKTAGHEGISLNGITVLNPAASPLLDKYAAAYHELRKHKGMTAE